MRPSAIWLSSVDLTEMTSSSTSEPPGVFAVSDTWKMPLVCAAMDAWTGVVAAGGNYAGPRRSSTTRVGDSRATSSLTG